MAIGETIRDFLVKVSFEVDPASEEKLNTSLTGSVLKANLLADALTRFASEFARAIGRTADMLSNLKSVSERTGASISNIRAWQYALTQFGISSNEATAALESFARQMRENPNFKAYWEGLVPDVKNFTDAKDQLDAIFKWLAEQPRWLAEQYNKKFHLAPDNMFDVIMRHYDQIKAKAKEHKEIMAAFGVSEDNAVENSRKMVQQMERLRDVGSAFFLNAINFLLPGFNKGLEDSFDLIMKNKDKINEWQTDFGKVMGGAGHIIKDLGIGIDMIAQTLGGWKNTLEFIAALFAGTLLAAMGPGGWLLIGVSAILVASAEIKQHWQDIVDKIKEVQRLENAPGSESESGETALPKEQVERMGQTPEWLKPYVGQGETDADKRTRDATEKTAKNTEQIAEGLRDQKKSWWDTATKAARDLWNGMTGGIGKYWRGEGGGGPGAGVGGSSGAGGGGAGGGGSPGYGGHFTPGATGTETQKAFAKSIYEKAKAMGIPETQAQLAALQASHESAYGTSDVFKRSNNMFGIKGEGDAGKSGEYAAFSSPEAGLRRWWEIIQKNWPGAAKATDLSSAVAGLRFGQQGGYAEDKAYGQRLIETFGRVGGAIGGVESGAGGPESAMTEPMAPRGTPTASYGMTTVTSPSGRRFTVNEKYAKNFQGFINDYERAGGVIGPSSGGLGMRPGNASYHPIGQAIDINQVGYGIRAKTGRTLDPSVEDALAKKWGLYPGHLFRGRSDEGHFEVRNAEAARKAIETNEAAADARNSSVVFRRPINNMHAIGKQSSLSSNVTMQNNNTFNMGSGGPHEAIQVASLVGRENERSAAKLRNTASSKLREFVPRVT